MEEKDAQDAQSGSNDKLLKEIAAQYAILDSAQNLINQLTRKAQQTKEKKENDKNSHFSLGPWVYHMKDLEKWVSETTEILDNEE